MSILREAFRNLQAFRSLYEAEGIDTLESDGVAINLWDLEFLYEKLPDLLPTRQYQAIELFLVHNLKETQVAAMMGIDESNPIGSYATSGLQKLIELIRDNALPKTRGGQDG